jgi:F0F1-type ATP synthase assembly protein I
MKHEDLPSLQELDQAINKAQSVQAGNNEQKKEETSAGSIIRVLSEIVAGTGVGGFIGYQIDSYFGILPAFTTVLGLLGFVGSMVNIYHAMNKKI